MDEIYRMLGSEHAADLELEAQNRQRATELEGGSSAQRSAAAVPSVVRRRKRLRVGLARLVARAGLWCTAPFALAILLAASVAGVGTTAAGAQQELGGTSETFTDLREDGSYFDPSPGRRVGVTPSVTIVEASEFDWADAGVGAAGAFGLVLLASGVVLIFATQRRRAA
jgi:uncharacterized iron-regulated membrane protein